MQVDVSSVEKSLDLPSNQVLALFNKVSAVISMSCLTQLSRPSHPSSLICSSCAQGVRKLYNHLQASKEAAVDRTLPQPTAPAIQPHQISLDDDLDQAAKVALHP